MHIRFEHHPTYAQQDYLLNGIQNQALAQGFPTHTRFSFFLYDDEQQTRGGIKGSNFYGALYIDYIYVDPNLRHQGFGKALLNHAEDWAKQQGCTFSTLTTMSFEAQDFYMKCGYTVEFEQTGYLHDASMIYLRKNL